MTNIILVGCNGRMGQMITGIVGDDPQLEIIAGVDVYDGIANSYPVYKSINECDMRADAVVDFSNASSVDGIVDWCVQNSTPLVECTTGLSEDMVNHIKDASQKVAILRSANMSLGINLLMKAVSDAVKVLSDAGFDVEIVEKHHRMKLDAPSGTAIALADAVNHAMDDRYEYVYDRSSVRKKRDDNEIGISAVRGGSIVGDHDVIFAGQDEVITFSHTAYSRAVFAKGAIQAAKYISGKPAGMYDMSNVIENK